MSGIVAIDMDLTKISQTISEMKIGIEGFNAVAYKDGNIIASSVVELIGKNLNDEEWSKGILDNGIKSITFNGAKI